MQLSKHLNLTSVGFSTGASSVVELDCANADGVLFVGVPASTASRTWSLALKHGDSTSSFANVSSTHTLTSTGVGMMCWWST